MGSAPPSAHAGGDKSLQPAQGKEHGGTRQVPAGEGFLLGSRRDLQGASPGLTFTQRWVLQRQLCSTSMNLHSGTEGH